jgi:alpha-tubulin suppressor-like RCC1 family protein
MMRLILIAMLCGCAGSLVDHAGISQGGDAGGDGGGTPDAGDAGPTPACMAACTSTPYGDAADPLCVGDTCTYACKGGKLKCATGCCDAAAISAGGSHTCAAATNGELGCWGLNDKHQLGADLDAAMVAANSSVAPLAGQIVTAVAAGSAHTCALVQGNGVWCWGDNTSGQSGGAVPHKVAGSDGALRLAAGGGHTCFATAMKTFCFGRNTQGQVGNGATETSPRLEPTEVSGVGGAVQIAAGDNHTCAIDGTSVFCWGANDRSQVGNGTASAAVSTPAQVMTGAGFTGLGANHGCAGSTSDSLSCWGANASNQVDGSGQDQRSPRGVLSNVLAVAGGTGHTCAIRRGGGVTCWGIPAQLGVVTTSSSEVNVVFPLAGPVQSIAAGSSHTCVIQNGAVLCWGSNQDGQLGISGAGASATPVPISGR